MGKLQGDLLIQGLVDDAKVDIRAVFLAVTRMSASSRCIPFQVKAN